MKRVMDKVPFTSYNTFAEIEADAALIQDAGERAAFLAQFKPDDAKFYLKDTVIQGTKEFLTAMGATDITPAAKGKAVMESAAGPGVPSAPTSSGAMREGLKKENLRNKP